MVRQQSPMNVSTSVVATVSNLWPFESFSLCVMKRCDVFYCCSLTHYPHLSQFCSEYTTTVYSCNTEEIKVASVLIKHCCFITLDISQPMETGRGWVCLPWRGWRGFYKGRCWTQRRYTLWRETVETRSRPPPELWPEKRKYVKILKRMSEWVMSYTPLKEVMFTVCFLAGQHRPAWRVKGKKISLTFVIISAG